MKEIIKDEFKDYKTKFSIYGNDPVVNGVIEGNNPGKIFMKSGIEGSYGVLWAMNEQVYFFAGNVPDNSPERDDMKRFIVEKIFKDALKNEENYFQTFFKQREWEEYFLDEFKEYLPFTVDKKVLHLESNHKADDWRVKIPEGYSVGLIDERNYEIIDDGDDRLFKDWWYDYASFTDKGLGTCVYEGDKAISCCFSCFAGAGAYETGAVTLPEYMNRGFCTLAANLYVEESLKKGIKPIWTCSESNVASLKTALRVGFSIFESKKYYMFALDETERYFDAAWFNYFESGNPSKAVHYLQKGMEKNVPESKGFHIFCARLFAANGDFEKAGRHLDFVRQKWNLNEEDKEIEEFKSMNL